MTAGTDNWEDGGKGLEGKPRWIKSARWFQACWTRARVTEPDAGHSLTPCRTHLGAQAGP